MVSQWSLSSPKRWWLILVVALVVRLYGITNPAADWHAFRQADTASVTREYVKHGIDWLRPHYQDLSNIQSGQDNLAGFRMVEFPIVNAILAMVLRTFPMLDLEMTSRFGSIVASLWGLVALYHLVKRLSGQKIAELSTLVMAVLPYSVYYSRAILPEPYMLAAYLTALWAFQAWLSEARLGWYVVSAVSLALAILLKPFVIFLAPVWLVLAWRKWSWRVLLLSHAVPLLVYVSVAVLPTVWWRWWIQQFPSGIPASSWLFNSNGIRWRPAWFRWLGWERLTKLQLGYIGVLFLPFVWFSRSFDTIVYAAWWLGIGIYVSVIATGNVQHDYYQVIMIPIVAISVAKGMTWLWQLIAQKISSSLASAVVSGLFAMMLVLSWYQVSGYYHVNHWEYVKAGRAADQLLPPDAKVIAPAFGDTQFLFQTNRTGWPIGFEIDDKIAKGATHYVSTSYDDEARQLEAKYLTVQKTNEYLILDLRTARQ